jgi:peptidoglycan/LPS O-acetylase OafA/YrhL
MSEPATPRHIGRSILALLTGMFVAIGLTLAADFLFHLIGVFPPLGQRASDSAFLLATVYRIVFSVLGSYITARLAPNRPMRLALIGGSIGLLASIVGAVATWNHQPSLGPHWYPLALVVTALPCAWLGGKLRLLQIPSNGAKQT